MAPLPREFREEVENAARSHAIGLLALLAQEAEGSPWQSEALRMIGRALGEAPAAPAEAASPARTILFTGHQVDAPGRNAARFPADKEPLARAAIRDAVQHEIAQYGRVAGIAGAASGGDILFHEICAELGVPAKLYLALPPALYVAESVAPAGADWVRRFYAIHSRVPSAPILASTKDLPAWLRHRGTYSIWQRNNLWMLNEALAGGACRVTLIALWNGMKGDGPGGTADMIAIASARGAETKVLDSNAIFGLRPHIAPTEATRQSLD